MKKILLVPVLLLFATYTVDAQTWVQAFEMQTNKANNSTINLGFVAGGNRTVGVDWGDGNIVSYPNISNNIGAPTNVSSATIGDQAIIKVYVDGSGISNLVCSNNGLTSLDLSRTNTLVRLTVSGNSLTTLDVSNQPNLQQLLSIGGYNTCFKGIDLSNNANLNTLTIRNGGLKYAKELDCSATNMTALSIQNDGPANANSLDACALDSIYRMLPNRTGKSQGTIFVGRSDYTKTPDNDYNGSNKTLVDGKNWVVKTSTNNAVLTGDGGACVLPPVAIAESDKSSTGFTANWQSAVGGADSYILNVYTKDGEENILPVVGSPFSGITATSYGVTGLSNADTYFYTVVTVKGVIESGLSNEIGPISLLSVGLADVTTDTHVFSSHGNIMFQATAGEVVEVFSVAGQKLLSHITRNGLNSIAVPAKGVVIVKINNGISKVVIL